MNTARRQFLWSLGIGTPATWLVAKYGVPTASGPHAVTGEFYRLRTGDRISSMRRWHGANRRARIRVSPSEVWARFDSHVSLGPALFPLPAVQLSDERER